MQEKIQALQKRIEELEKESQQRKTRQLRDPLDVITLALIRKQLPVYNGTNTSGSVAVGGYIEVNIDGLIYKLLYK